MNQFKTTILAGTTFLLLLLQTQVHASPPENPRVFPWSFSGRAGTAIYISELRQNFNGLENEFSHQPGISFSFSAARHIGEHWEAGISLDAYTLSGNTSRALFSANGIHGSFRNIDINRAVHYDNQSSSLLFFLRYYFWKFSNTRKNNFRIDPYAEIGGGMNVFATQVKYKDPLPGENPLIFSKAGDNNGHVGQFSIGLGAKAGFGKQWQLMLSLNAELVNYDCVDGVHNYTDGIRNHAKTIVTRLMAGISLPIGKPKTSSSYSRSPYQPWSPR